MSVQLFGGDLKSWKRVSMILVSREEGVSFRERTTLPQKMSAQIRDMRLKECQTEYPRSQ